MKRPLGGVFLVPLLHGAIFLQEGAEDVADVPSQDLRVGGDEAKRYFLIGPGKEAKAPAEGFRLLVVLPGGDGSADFHPFVKRIFQNALPEGYLVAQLVSPPWKTENFIWPTKLNRVPKQKYATEELIEEVIAEVRKKHKLDPRFLFTLGWSSGGPPSYTISLQENRSVTGSFISQSVFYPQNYPPLKRAKGYAYYIHHSPEDRSCKFELAEEARETLKKQGAKVEIRTYKGGHGWTEDQFGHIRRGIEWLERNHAEPPKEGKKGARR